MCMCVVMIRLTSLIPDRKWLCKQVCAHSLCFFLLSVLCSMRITFVTDGSSMSCKCLYFALNEIIDYKSIPFAQYFQNGDSN